MDQVFRAYPDDLQLVVIAAALLACGGAVLAYRRIRAGMPKTSAWRHSALETLVASWCALLVIVLLIPNGGDGGYGGVVEFVPGRPLSYLLLYALWGGEGSVALVLAFLGLYVLLFAPLGFLLPLRVPAARRLVPFTAISVLAITAVEATQYLIGSPAPMTSCSELSAPSWVSPSRRQFAAIATPTVTGSTRCRTPWNGHLGHA